MYDLNKHPLSQVIGQYVEIERPYKQIPIGFYRIASVSYLRTNNNELMKIPHFKIDGFDTEIPITEVMSKWTYKQPTRRVDHSATKAQTHGTLRKTKAKNTHPTR